MGPGIPDRKAFDIELAEFIAVLAHELRNPLAAIRAGVDVLQLSGVHDSRTEQFRGLVDRQSAAMARMLDDLLDAAHVILGKVEVSLETLDLVEVVREVVGGYELRARQAGLAVDTRLPGGPCFIRADPARLRQVIDNLVSNAIKFTPASGQISLELLVKEDDALLEVRDSGIGFDAEVGKRLFEPFFQSSKDPARQAGGLGLGLALAAHLSERQRGKLSASSEGPGMGATFSLSMPRVARGP